MKQLKAAIVGAGLISTKKHIPAFCKMRNRLELAALCDLDFQRACSVASAFRIPHVYANFPEMLETERPDLIDICTPPRTHVEVAVEALRNGCHVLIEKPMALNVFECDQILNASRRFGPKVCIAHTDLFYAPFMKAVELVKRGEVGEFRGMRIVLSTPTEYMTARENHWAHCLPGGVIGETGPHAVYLSLAFINPIHEIQVEAMRLLKYPWSRFEDYRIDLVGEKAMSSITLSYATRQWLARVEILGETAFLLLDLEGGYLVKYRRPQLKPFPVGLSLLSEAAQIARTTLSNAVKFATGKLATTHEILVERFLNSIVKGIEPPVTAEEGREAVRVMDLIVQKLQFVSESKTPAMRR